MSQEDTREEQLPPGSLLREHRLQKDLSLEEVSEFTKISLPNLRAIEDDDYDNLPPEAFCRAYYSMYAKFLELDPEETLASYLEHRGIPAAPSNNQRHPPLKKSGQFSSYAEPAPITSGTSLGIILAICLLTISALCWYFNWNPLSSFLSVVDSPLLPGHEEQMQPPPEPVVEETGGLNDEQYVITATQGDNDLPDHADNLPLQSPLDNDPEAVVPPAH
ncbi:MAG: helix-turn-helix domain-containing protein [Thermodesulfobacteriota bacterium]